jgi:hypothetical protein
MINRRDFLKTSILGLSSSIIWPHHGRFPLFQEWPVSETLGRNCTGGIINIRNRPSPTSEIVKSVYEDTIVVWLKEVIGENPAGRSSRIWIETPEGYIYSPVVQPVKNLLNPLVFNLPETSIGKGMWVEVTIPYVDLYLANPPARSPWLKEIPKPRLYYSQVVWVDDIQVNSEGATLYQVNELYGTYGDIFWAAGEAFRQISSEEISPINPDSEEKKIAVNLNQQTLSCFEGSREVYFCKIASGAIFNASGNSVDEWSTPLGPHPIWRKLVSIHMSGGSTGAGWDTMGIPWTCLFAGTGVAVHSTFWHNGFGERLSHGCVNARPDDAKWIFRWSLPSVAIDPGDITVQMPGGTIVEVVEI